MSHLAAISSAKESLLKVVSRITPKPGPRDVLIEVHAIALNPIDYYQRDMGLPPITHYPAVLGSDISGVVLSSGSEVGSDGPKSGTRVAAFAPTFYTQGVADSGAFQKCTIIPADSVTPIPDSISFNQAAIIPMAVITTFSGLYSIGLPRDTQYTPADKQAMLVWGGASSVGSAAIQVAKILGFTVYVAASEKHASYLKTLGAAQVFDYKNPDVVSSIVAAAKKDGLEINWGYDAVGQVPHSAAVLAQAKNPSTTAKLASAVRLERVTGWDPKAVPGVEVKFVSAPSDLKARTEHFSFVFNSWLKEKLASGEFVPSPGLKVCPGGLEGLNDALDELKAGVSGTKLVLEI